MQLVDFGDPFSFPIFVGFKDKKYPKKLMEEYSV